LFLTVSPLEGGVDVVADAAPHAHVARVVEFDFARVQVDAPVGGAAEQVRAAVVAPREGGVQFFQLVRQPQLRQWVHLGVLSFLVSRAHVIFCP
jgi:hypothetical protein